MRWAGCGKQPEDTGPCPSPATVDGWGDVGHPPTSVVGTANEPLCKKAQ